MEKFRTKSMRYLAFALIAAMISVFGLGAWEGIKAIAAEGDEEEVTAPASFDSEKDTVETKFIFYTTDNASKKVPAANKWIKTNLGKVDVSNLTKGKTLYFANSTTPSLDEIVAVVVPASPVLSTAKYDAKGETLDKKFVFQTTVKVVDGKKTKSQKVDVPKARIEIKVNDNSTWKPFSEAITDGTLQGLQKEGATVYARIAPTKTDIKYDEDTKTCTFVDAGISEEEDTSIENGENITRYGVAKTFKIAKKAAGPAVKVDYANHSITLKKGQSYIKTDDEYAINEENWKNVTESKGEKVYFNSVTDAEYYGVKTATSLTTYLLIPSTVSFADTSSTVTIQGGNEENATLAITYNPETEDAVLKNVAYQYAIVDLSADNVKDLIKDGVFDYKKSVDAKISWKTVKTKAGKDDTVGTATASLAWKSVKGKQVLVRKAAAGTEFSSQVVVFNAPTGDGFAKYAPEAKMPEVNCWTMLTQANYGSGFAGNNTNMKFCANISKATYDVEAKSINFDIVAGAEISETAKVVLKVGKTEYALDNALVVEDNNIKTDMGDTNATTKNKTVAIDLSKVKDFPAADANKVAIIVPAGYAANEAGVATAAKTINITVDNKAPKATKVVLANGTVTITVDDAKLKLAEGATIEAKDADDKDIIVFTDVKFDAKKKTITAKYEVKVTTVEKVTLTLDGITDAAGNKIDTGDVLKNLANPGYVKPSEEPTSSEGNE